MKLSFGLYLLALSYASQVYGRALSGNHNSLEEYPLLQSLFGIILFIFASLMFWFNEDQYITLIRSRYYTNSSCMDKLEKICREANCDIIDPDFGPYLMLMTGKTATNEILVDEQFGIHESNLQQLERVIEMYQWKQTRHTKKQKRYNQTNTYHTYSYNLAWSKDFSISDSFGAGHENYQEKWVVQNHQSSARIINLGEYILTDSLKQQIKTPEQFELTETNVNIDIVSSNFLGIHEMISRRNNYIMFEQNPQQQSCGDMRVSFNIITCKDVTIINRISGNTFVPYQIQNKREIPKAAINGQIDWLFESTLTKKQAFDTKLGDLNTSAFRFILLLAMGLGIWIIPSSYLTLKWYEYIVIATSCATIIWNSIQDRINVPYIIQIAFFIGLGVFYYIR